MNKSIYISGAILICSFATWPALAQIVPSLEGMQTEKLERDLGAISLPQGAEVGDALDRSIREDSQQEDVFDPILRLPRLGLPEILPLPPSSSLPTLSLLVERRLFTAQIQKRVIGGNDVPGLINDLAQEPLKVQARLRQISLSSTDRIGQCNAASQAIADNYGFRGALDSLVRRTDLPAGAPEAFSLYAQACFRQVFAQSDPSEPAFVAEVRARAGVLKITPSPSKPDVFSYCSAFLIDGKTAVTARHCFFNDQSLRLPNDSMRFIRLAGDVNEEVAVRISPRLDPNPRETFRARKVADDFVTIDLEREIASLTALPLGSDPDVFAFDAMFQVGFFNLFNYVERASNTQIDPLRHAYAIDESEGCAAVRYSEECIVQLCQSMRQTSGAALIGIRNNQLHILGTLFGGGDGRTGRSADCFGPGVQEVVATKINFSSRSR